MARLRPQRNSRRIFSCLSIKWKNERENCKKDVLLLISSKPDFVINICTAHILYIPVKPAINLQTGAWCVRGFCGNGCVTPLVCSRILPPRRVPAERSLWLKQLQLESIFHPQPLVLRLSSFRYFADHVVERSPWLQISACIPPHTVNKGRAVLHAVSTSWLLWMMLRFCCDINADTGLSAGASGFFFVCLCLSINNICVCVVVYGSILCFFFLLYPEPGQARTVFPADSSGTDLCRDPVMKLKAWTEAEKDVDVLVLCFFFFFYSSSGAEYQDIEVHLRRQKSGFGFRVLGGDEAGQPVSPETREKARMAMGVEPCHFLLSNPLHHTLCTPNPWPLTPERVMALAASVSFCLSVEVTKQHLELPTQLIVYHHNNHFNTHCMRH